MAGSGIIRVECVLLKSSFGNAQIVVIASTVLTVCVETRASPPQVVDATISSDFLQPSLRGTNGVTQFATLREAGKGESLVFPRNSGCWLIGISRTKTSDGRDDRGSETMRKHAFHFAFCSIRLMTHVNAVLAILLKILSFHWAGRKGIAITRW